MKKIEGGDTKVQHRSSTTMLDDNRIFLIIGVVFFLLWAVFYFAIKLPDEIIKNKHDLVSRVVCDKVLPFTNEISKETTFSENIKKIEVVDDEVEVTAVLDGTTVVLPDDILEIEILTLIKNNSIMRLSGQVVIKNFSNDQVGTGFKYEVVGDKITVIEQGGAAKLFDYSFSMESGISTWKSDIITQFSISGLESLACVFALAGIYKMVITEISLIKILSDKKRKQCLLEEERKRQNIKIILQFFAQILAILALFFSIFIFIYNAYV